MQDHALLYLARSSGFETVDEMIREKMTDYAQQNLTYEEAAEELVGDAWRGIFSNESDFKRWVEFRARAGREEQRQGRNHPHRDEPGEGDAGRHCEPGKGSADP